MQLWIVCLFFCRWSQLPPGMSNFWGFPPEKTDPGSYCHLGTWRDITRYHCTLALQQEVFCGSSISPANLLVRDKVYLNRWSMRWVLWNVVCNALVTECPWYTWQLALAFLVYHFLMECSLHNNHRNELFAKVINLCPIFQEMQDIERFIYMLSSGGHIVRLVAAFIYENLPS